MAKTEDVERVVEQAAEETRRIDILVNKRGILRDKVLWKLTYEGWKAVLAVHVGGSFRFTRACTPHFGSAQFGRVVNVTSYTELHGNFGQAAYAAAKVGIIGFTKAAAKELARFGVTVNAIPNAETRMIDSNPRDAYAGEGAGRWPLQGRGFGFNPLLVTCGREVLAGILRPGNAGANNAADHLTVLELALAQLPQTALVESILACTDSAGESHEFAFACHETDIRFSLGYAIQQPVAKRSSRCPKPSGDRRSIPMAKRVK